MWLNADMLSAYDYWQFWRNTGDSDIGRFLRLFTELPMDEIERAEKLRDAEINDAKKMLADAATAMCHGEDAARAAAETAQATFVEGAIGDALAVITLPRAELEAGITAFTLFHRTGLCASGGEARRLIKGGGARLNDEPVTGETQIITLADVTGDDVIKLSAGKKRHALVRAE